MTRFKIDVVKRQLILSYDNRPSRTVPLDIISHKPLKPPGCMVCKEPATMEAIIRHPDAGAIGGYLLCQGCWDIYKRGRP